LPAETGALGELTKPELWQPRQELLRAGAGIGLAAVYGLALGARGGGAGLLRHAAGASVTLAILSVTLVPALFVALALTEAPVAPGELLSAAARALAATGLVLASVAPAAALLVVTIGNPDAAAVVGWLGLALAGGLGVLAFASAMRGHLAHASAVVALKSYVALLGFGVLTLALAVRLFGALLPVLAGAS
jgi:hypothetical protein